MNLIQEFYDKIRVVGNYLLNDGFTSEKNYLREKETVLLRNLRIQKRGSDCPYRLHGYI